MGGHDFTQIPCAFCRKSVIDIDALWCDGVAYHEQCYSLSLSNEIKQYQKKIELGSITMVEAKRMDMLQGDLNLIRDSAKRNKYTKLPKIKSKNILRSSVPVFTLPLEQRQKFFEEQKNILKKNELLREVRWAWEAFSVFEKQNGLQKPDDITSINFIKYKMLGGMTNTTVSGGE